MGFIMVLTIATLNATRATRKAGPLDLPEELFTEKVVVTETVFRNEATTWAAPTGTPLPEERGEVAEGQIARALPKLVRGSSEPVASERAPAANMRRRGFGSAFTSSLTDIRTTQAALTGGTYWPGSAGEASTPPQQEPPPNA